ncbi:hypothetical protein PFICI_14091 [Pestalotiopsis fici W106-1]|uniref:Zn(2)-C6 fungal-type domain-containing protein n=1 Tax=Pestalotiopsis fici (strain W106-1 / CGMCC3.15140) TaxID=1229662 RepID=W3WK01_PESFW|nr:uncharacterized protein PFICI_14091 [Pestalotiopsis fici W106-1]ETS74225.1 hypothetical protein PFICI_14091 [Pestalotiopsis fici W106-1]
MPRSSITSSTSSQHRLPVNQRRRKVLPENRKRVATACNSCNVRRIKCSGERPCLQCRNASRECRYPISIEKISVPRAELEQLKSKCIQLEACLENAVPDENKRRYLLTQVTQSPADTGADNAASPEARDNLDEEEGGRLLQDADGALRYFGPISSTLFLDSLKRFFAITLPAFIPFSMDTSSMISSGPQGRCGMQDTCAPNVQNVDPFWHPSKTDMTLMLARLQYTFQDGCGDFASGGIYYWNDLDVTFFNKKKTEISNDAQSIRELSLLHAAFAMATLLDSPTGDRRNSVRRSETFFARARMLLGNPLNTTLRNILDIPILSMMVMYLIEIGRRDTAYMYVSVGLQIAVMYGVHRGWVNDESCKRSFWTLYVLDRCLSVLDGRPPSISDDAIQLLPPLDVSGLPPAMGLRAHIELARIAGYIVCNTYQVSPWDHCTTSNEARVEKTLGLLSNWKNRLPAELQIDGSLCHDRACYQLHMEYNQLLMLTVRPVLFEAVKRAVRQQFGDEPSNPNDECRIDFIRICSQAACQTLKLAKDIRDMCQCPQPSLQMLHHIFDAAVILILDQVLDIRTQSTSHWAEIAFAIECFDTEDRVNNPCQQNPVQLLRNLQALVESLRNHKSSESSWNGSRTSSVPPIDTQSLANTSYHVGFILNPSNAPTNPMLSSTSDVLISQLASWTAFDGAQDYRSYPLR